MHSSPSAVVCSLTILIIECVISFSDTEVTTHLNRYPVNLHTSAANACRFSFNSSFKLVATRLATVLLPESNRTSKSTPLKVVLPDRFKYCGRSDHFTWQGSGTKLPSLVDACEWAPGMGELTSGMFSLFASRCNTRPRWLYWRTFSVHWTHVFFLFRPFAANGNVLSDPVYVQRLHLTFWPSSSFCSIEQLKCTRDQCFEGIHLDLLKYLMKYLTWAPETIPIRSGEGRSEFAFGGGRIGKYVSVEKQIACDIVAFSNSLVQWVQGNEKHWLLSNIHPKCAELKLNVYWLGLGCTLYTSDAKRCLSVPQVAQQ